MSKERNPERGQIRQSLNNKGALHVPEEYLDANYHYRWINYYNDKIHAAIAKERLGYEPVLASEITHQFQSKVITNAKASEGFVTCDLKGGQAVLMKIPRDVYLERKKLEKEDRDASYKKAMQDGLEMSSDGTKKTFSFTNIS